MKYFALSCWIHERSHCTQLLSLLIKLPLPQAQFILNSLHIDLCRFWAGCWSMIAGSHFTLHGRLRLAVASPRESTWVKYNCYLSLCISNWLLKVKTWFFLNRIMSTIREAESIYENSMPQTWVNEENIYCIPDNLGLNTEDPPEKPNLQLIIGESQHSYSTSLSPRSTTPTSPDNTRSLFSSTEINSYPTSPTSPREYVAPLGLHTRVLEPARHMSTNEDEVDYEAQEEDISLYVRVSNISFKELQWPQCFCLDFLKYWILYWIGRQVFGRGINVEEGYGRVHLS